MKPCRLLAILLLAAGTASEWTGPVKASGAKLN